MIFFRPFILLLASGLLLGGCATHAPAGTGNTVRNIMASQILPPQLDKRRPGTDAGIAISAVVYGALMRGKTAPVLAPPARTLHS